MEITKAGDFRRFLAAVPAARTLINDALYIGCALAQSDGAWTRQGPTWWSNAERCFITVGVGVANWGTKKGLAELASATDGEAKPHYHALGLSMVPAETGNLIVFVPRTVLTANPSYKPVLDLLDVVEGDLGISHADEPPAHAKPKMAGRSGKRRAK